MFEELLNYLISSYFRNFSSRKSTNMGISGSVQKRAGIMQSSKKSAIGNKLVNTANKKVCIFIIHNSTRYWPILVILSNWTSPLMVFHLLY